MKNEIFIPKIIRIGFQKRDDTYTKRLGYIIYFDEKNKLRKQASWESWRDKELGFSDFENFPTGGFVLNKKVGDYSSDYNHRKAHCRVYDPRNFEFEIEIDNLLYILENSNSIKGKGLGGDFVYGWMDSKLVLIPVDSPDYQKFSEFTNLRINPEKITAKDLIVGATYRMTNNQDWIYLGKFDEWDEYYSWRRDSEQKYNGKKHYFYSSGSFQRVASVSGRIGKLISSECISNFSDIMDKLECKDFYSPYNKNGDRYVLVDDKELGECYQKGWHVFIDTPMGVIETSINHKYDTGYYLGIGTEPYWKYSNGYQSDLQKSNWYKSMFPNIYTKELKELNNVFKFKKLVRYLKNGKEMK